MGENSNVPQLQTKQANKTILLKRNFGIHVYIKTKLPCGLISNTIKHLHPTRIYVSVNGAWYNQAQYSNNVIYVSRLGKIFSNWCNSPSYTLIDCGKI